MSKMWKIQGYSNIERNTYIFYLFLSASITLALNCNSSCVGLKDETDYDDDKDEKDNIMIMTTWPVIRFGINSALLWGILKDFTLILTVRV